MVCPVCNKTSKGLGGLRIWDEWLLMIITIQQSAPKSEMRPKENAPFT